MRRHALALLLLLLFFVAAAQPHRSPKPDEMAQGKQFYNQQCALCQGNGIELRKPGAARSSEFIRSVLVLESQQINLLLRAPLNSMPLLCQGSDKSRSTCARLASPC